nr:aminoglycoside phosphotransferase family protein [Bacillus alkalicola]
MKLGVDGKEFLTEVKTLEKFRGQGYVQLIDKEEELRAFLLSYKEGDTPPLDDVEAISSVMKRSPKIKTDIEIFPTIEEQFHSLQKYRNSKDLYEKGYVNEALLRKAEDMIEVLLNSETEKVLLHGDLHAGNIIYDGERYTAIDPKGVVGELAFEPAQFFLNAPISLLKDEKIVNKWLLFFKENNHLDPDRVIQYAFCKAVLSLVWLVEDNDPNWEEGVEYAKVIEMHV